MNMKSCKNILFLSIILFAIIDSSCKQSGNKVKIALMLPTLKILRFEKDKSFFLKEAEKLGCEGIVVQADNNESTQFIQAQELINQGVKSLVIAAVNANTAGEMVREARAKGIKVIAYDGILGNCELDYLITFDNEKIGVMMAQYALPKAPNGNYIIIGGDKSNLNSIQIRNGEQKVLEPSINSGKIKIAYSDYTDTWSRDDAYMIIKKYISLTGGDQPAAVLGANDNIADGIIQAFEEAKMPLPVITGQDASLLGLRNIVKGKQSMTVYKPIKNLATMAADVAYKAARGEKIDGVSTTTWNGLYEIPTIVIEMYSVDNSNMESTVIADGFEKKEDIMK